MQLHYARSDNSLRQAGYQSTTRTLRRPCSSFSFLYDEAIESLPFRYSISATVRDAVLPLPESSLLLLLSRVSLSYPSFSGILSSYLLLRPAASAALSLRRKRMAQEKRQFLAAPFLALFRSVVLCDRQRVACVHGNKLLAN